MQGRVLDTRITRLKKSSKVIVHMSAEKLRELEEAYNTLPSPDNLNKVNLQARVVSQLYLEKAKQCLFFC